MSLASSSYDGDEDETRIDGHGSRRVRFDDDGDAHTERSASPQARYRHGRAPSPVRIIRADRRTSPPRPLPPRHVRHVRTYQVRSRSHERATYGGGIPPPPRPPRPTRPSWEDDSESDYDDGIRIYPDHLRRGPGPSYSGRRRERRARLAAASSSSSDEGAEYRKKGKTRIPSRLVSRQALVDLGYPYTVESGMVIIPRALGAVDIDDLIKLSADYKKSDTYVDYNDDEDLDIRIRTREAPRRNPPPPRYDRVRADPYNDRDASLADFILARGELQAKCRHLDGHINDSQRELKAAELKRKQATEENDATMSQQEAKHLQYMVEKEACDKHLKEQEKIAGSLDVLKSRLQILKLDEADVLLQQERASKDEEAVTDYFRFLAERLLTVQVEADQVSQKLRSAEAAKEACLNLSRQLRHLTEVDSEAELRKMQLRGQQAYLHAAKSDEDKIRRKLISQNEKRRSINERLEQLYHDRHRLEQNSRYTPPSPQRIVIKKNPYDDDTDSSYKFSRDGSPQGRESDSRVPRPAPIIINKNHYYSDADSETLSDGSSDDYGRNEAYDMSRRTYKAVEKVGLSVRFPLNKGVRSIQIQDTDEDGAALTSEARAWKEDQTVLADGVTSTKLSVIHAAEYSEDETGIGKTILMCLNGPRERESCQSAQMRWLHIQQPSLKFKTLENIVVHCSHIDGDLRRIAVEAMEKVKDKFSGISDCGAFLEPGSILRYIGERDDEKGAAADSRETEPVVFLSSPFLTLQPFSNRRASKFEYRPRSLLQSLYGYDVGSERESGQVVQKLNVSKSKKDMLHINQLWCLTIGSKTLITMSEQSAAQICGESITMDSRNSNNKEPLVVRLTDQDDREYRMVVERDCNYVDFLIHAVARVAGQDATAPEWVLYDENNDVLTPDRWISIMSSADSVMRTFFVRERNVANSDSEASERDAHATSRTGAQGRSASQPHHTSRSSAYASREGGPRIHSRRSRSQYDEGSRRSASRPHSYHGGHARSHSIVSARERMIPPRYYHGGPRSSHASGAYGSPSYDSYSEVARRKLRLREHNRIRPLSESAGVLVPYTARPSESEERSKLEVVRDSLHGSESPESSRNAKGKMPQDTGEDSNEGGGASSPPSDVPNAQDGDNDEIEDDLGDFKWSHLSDILEERSSSAPTPKVGASSGRDDSRPNSDTGETEEQTGVEQTEWEKDPRNMQLILRSRGLGLGTAPVTPEAEPPSSDHSGISIDISEPWRGMVIPPSGDDRSHYHSVPERVPSPGCSRVSNIHHEDKTFDGLSQVASPSRSPAEDALYKEGLVLDDLYIRYSSAQERGDSSPDIVIHNDRFTQQKLVIQGLLSGASTLPEDLLVSRDIAASTRILRDCRERQLASSHYDVGSEQEAAGNTENIKVLEKSLRRLRLVKQAIESMDSDAEGSLVEARRRLEGHLDALLAAEAAGDMVLAADLKYYAVPEAEVALKQLSSAKRTAPEPNASASQPNTSVRPGPPLDRVSILQWAQSRAQFSPEAPPEITSIPRDFPEVDFKPLLGREAHDEARPSPPKSPPDRIRIVRYHDRSSRDSSARYYEVPRRDIIARSRSRSSEYQSPPPLRSWSRVGVEEDLSDDETLAPGIILNEMPRPRRDLPEVYDPEVKPDEPAVKKEKNYPLNSLAGSDRSSTTERSVCLPDEMKPYRAYAKVPLQNDDDDGSVLLRSQHTAERDQPTKTEVTRKIPSTEEAHRFRRMVLRRYAPTIGLDYNTRIELVGGSEEVVEDEEVDGPFADGCRKFYRKDPKPEAGGKTDWVDEYVIDHKNLPFFEGAVFKVRIEWPPLPAAQVTQCAFDPFLRWRVKSSDQDRTPEEVDRSVLKVLGNMDESLQRGDFYHLYSRTFMCTLRDLFERHDFLSRLPKSNTPVLPDFDPGDTDLPEPENNKGSGNGEDTTVGDRSPSAERKPGLHEGDDASITLPGNISEQQTESEKPHPGVKTTSRPSQEFSNDSPPEGTDQQSQSMGTLSHDRVVMKSLLDVSKELLGAYMPAEGSPLLNSIYQRFWGNVDEIFRHIIWETTHVSRQGDGATYFIRDFDVPSVIIGRVHQSVNQKDSWSGCPQCQSGRHYTLITDALAHLHKDHFDCSAKIQQPYDDPCFVWVRRLDPLPPLGVRGFGSIALIEDFTSHLLLISRYSKELHNLVASIHGSAAQSRPQLPTNIVLAFEKIMAMYMIQAHRLSLNNARGQRRSRNWELNEKIDELDYRSELAQRQVMDHLTEAKKDIILLRGTSRQIDSLSVEAVGAEFLVLSLMTNLQNRPVVNKPAPSFSDRADFVELYQRYTSSLRFQANRRPKKRVFLDIHDLEEELDALHGMLEAQKSLLCNYLKLLSPGSTRATNATRVGQYRIERAYGRKQQKSLDAKEEGIRILREKSGVLKEQVKTTIEILEEDHGKAIRVFTFVTLLFLPLSFVTSFMGMNTTDIRDTEWSQRIFWATGLPVTIVVVILALIYAYRGERIQDWVVTNMRPKGRKMGRSMGGSFAWSGELPADGDTFLIRGGLKKRGVIRVDSDALLRSSKAQKNGSEPDWKRDARERLWAKQKSRGASGMRRRRTGESLAR